MSSVPQREICDCADWRVGWFEQQNINKMALKKNNWIVYKCNWWARDIAVGTYICQCKELGRIHVKMLVWFELPDILFMWPISNVNFARQHGARLRDDRNAESLDL